MQYQVNLGRAARTDAGVHAAGNIVSLKMICEIPGVPDVTARINELLPPEIRLWSFVREHAQTYLDYPLANSHPGHRPVYKTPSTLDCMLRAITLWAHG
jgi:hypothetical protein